MSRVYTANVITDVTQGVVAYVGAFQKALGSTRIAFAGVPSPGTSLTDLLLNLFGSGDPYLDEEVSITASWSVWTEWHSVDSQLHVIPVSFKATWPPPVSWAKSVDWHPLSQNNPRHYVRNYHRTRK